MVQLKDLDKWADLDWVNQLILEANFGHAMWDTMEELETAIREWAGVKTTQPKESHVMLQEMIDFIEDISNDNSKTSNVNLFIMLGNLDNITVVEGVGELILVNNTGWLTERFVLAMDDDELVNFPICTTEFGKILKEYLDA